MIDEQTKDLVIIRVFDAPRELVWRAWTDPKLLSQWWGPRGVTNPVCEVDAKVGGTMYIVMLAGPELGEMQGNEWPVKGIFQEVQKPEKLVYTSSAIMGGKPILETLTTVTFQEHEGKTTMTLHVVVTKTTPQAEGPLSGMKIGWTQSIDKLGEFVTRKAS